MKASLLGMKSYISFAFTLLFAHELSAQTMEWRLAHPVYSNVDPDSTGPAKGSVSFKLQIRTVSNSANDITAISVGWSYQSDKHIIPSMPGCDIVASPPNVLLSQEFALANYAITISNQCNSYNSPRTIGDQIFDKITVVLLEGDPISVGREWKDMFTATLWTSQQHCSNAGFVITHSSFYGSPGPLGTYAVATGSPVKEYDVNSLTYTTPLRLCNMPDSSITNNSTIFSNSLKTYDVSLYPTIVTGVMNIKIKSSLSQRLRFQLKNMTGTLIQEIQKEVVKGSNIPTLEINKNLNSGLYFLVVDNGRERSTHKFIKQ